MLSAVGTGSILFTPRVASQYQYDLLWLMLTVVTMMWIMITEATRYALYSGNSLLHGMSLLPGPRNWAVWWLFLPQLAAAAVGIAGLAGVIGSALAVKLSGSTGLYAIAVIITCATLTAVGSYKRIEQVSMVMALVLVSMAVFAAFQVFPDTKTLLAGAVPKWPETAKLYIIQPWVGTILAGSMGIIWFAYWSMARGFAGGEVNAETENVDTADPYSRATSENDETFPHQDILQSWFSLLRKVALLGVVSGSVVILAFLVLGAELLAPAGILPQGVDVAKQLMALFADAYGSAGGTILLGAIVIALGGSVFANQDGWGRTFADITRILIRDADDGDGSAPFVSRINAVSRRLPIDLRNREHLRCLFVLSITVVVPVLIVTIFKDPVAVMSTSGIIAAAHTPFIVLATLLVNLRQLPPEARPGALMITATIAAGVFYLFFSIIALSEMFG